MSTGVRLPGTTPQQRDMMDVRAYAVRSTLERTNKLLGLHDSRVVVIHPGSKDAPMEAIPPAWTDGRVVTINGFQEPMYTALRDGWTEDDILIVTALNYHELAHCFFMPRLDTPLMKRIRDAGYWNAWNILQDMHDESLFVSRYRPSTHYFTRVATEYFARTKDQTQLSYVLVAGRRFLPVELHDFFRDEFTRPDLLDEVDRIADEYVATVYPRDETEMFTLVQSYHELLSELLPESGAEGVSQVSEHREGDAETGPMVPLHGKTLDEEEQDDAQSRVGKVGGSSTGSNPSGGSPGMGQDANEAENRDAGDESEEGEEDEPGTSRGGGPGAGQERARPELDDLLDEVADRASAEVAHELADKSNALDHAIQDYKLDIDPLSYRQVNLDDDTADAARKVERALRRLKEDFDPGWHRAESDGRLDFRRVVGHTMTGDLNVFKRWDEGVHDVLDIEAVVAIDLSGSMQGSTLQVGKALWAIHNSLKTHQAEVTVLGFNTDVFLLRQRGESPESFIREYPASGGTSLAPALLEANKVFAASRRPLKLLFVVTDGSWYDQAEAQALLDEGDYRSFIVGINFDVREYERLRAVEVARTIRNITELPELFRNIVTSVARHRAEVIRMQGR